MSDAVGVAEAGERRVRGGALHKRILEAARETFLGEGFDASMDAVAASAGTTKATVYKHFGNKEALFVSVVEAALDRALDEPVRLVSSRLGHSAHLRKDLVDACRAWVDGLAAPDMIRLRNLVAGELRRFPELGAAWRERGPGRFHPVIADALRHLVEQRQLSISDVDLAVLQLSGLVISPHLVYGAYGDPVDGVTREQLISCGVDMFIDHYRYRVNA
jgi:TetR/AcrR family transcriptional repressor of mexJK operon